MRASYYGKPDPLASPNKGVAALANNTLIGAISQQPMLFQFEVRQIQSRCKEHCDSAANGGKIRFLLQRCLDQTDSFKKASVEHLNFSDHTLFFFQNQILEFPEFAASLWSAGLH